MIADSQALASGSTADDSRYATEQAALAEKDPSEVESSWVLDVINDAERGRWIATIGAESEGKTGAATVTVSPVAAASVTVEPGSATVQVGRTSQLTATIRDAAGNVLASSATVKPG